MDLFKKEPVNKVLFLDIFLKYFVLLNQKLVIPLSKSNTRDQSKLIVTQIPV